MSDTQHTVSLRLVADVADAPRAATRVKVSLAEMADAARKAGQDVQAATDRMDKSVESTANVAEESAERQTRSNRRRVSTAMEAAAGAANEAAAVSSAGKSVSATAEGAATAVVNAAGRRATASIEAAAAAGNEARAVQSAAATIVGSTRSAQDGIASSGQEAARQLGQAVSGLGDVRSRIDAITGVTGSKSSNDRGADIAAYGAELDRLRAKFDPLFAAGQQCKATLAEIADATAKGALTDAQAAAAKERLKDSFAAQARAINSIASPAASAAAFNQLSRAVDQFEAEFDPAARAAQALAARTAVLDKALATGAISAQRYASMMDRLKGGYDAVTGAGRLTQQQSIQLGYQLNDVFTSLASGASPFMVVAQQGGQITQIFGGVRQTLARIPPVAWMAAAAVAVIAGPALVVGLRLSEIGKETRKFEASIAALNPGLGVSAQRLREISFAVADTKGLGRDAVSAGISAIIASGRIRGEAMVAGLAGVAGDIAAVKGGELASWAEKLAEGFGKGAAGVRELDEALKFLTPSQARSIEALERQGDRAGALAIAMGALEGKFGGSAKAMQSSMEDAFGQMGRAWDRFVEDLAKTDFAQKGAAMGTALIEGLRRAFAVTDQDRLASLNLRINEMQAEGPNDWGGIVPFERANWQARLDTLIAQRDVVIARINASNPPSTPAGTVPGGVAPAPPARWRDVGQRDQEP